MVPGYGFRIIAILFLFVCVKSQTIHVDGVLISRGKTVTMSSTLNYIHLWSATFAVDGNMSRDADTCKCCASTDKGPDQTFTLDLEKSYNISRIEILGRNDDSPNGEISGLEVYASTSANPQDGLLIGTLTNREEEVVQVTTSTTYQYVIVKSTTAQPNFVIICEIQVYTQDCSTPCGNCKTVTDCNKVNGHCSNGCKAGFKGDFCNTACPGGFYGDCSIPCGNCKTVTDCNTVNGHCSNGCKAGFKGDFCNTACPGGFYGDCSIPCGNCKTVTDCNTVNGHCSNGCKAGFKGDFCNTACPGGFYGDCSIPCGNCKTVTDCNTVNGHCSNGCKAGFKGDFCNTACPEGFYGDCSTHCGNCKTVTDCNKIDGHCSNGCKAGFKGDVCNTECQHGTFGENCNSVCHCANNATCDKGKGTCSNGQCDFGYTGNSCSTECENGKFGDRCKSACGHCFNDVTCYITTGLCAGGCASGYNGTFCNASCPGGSYGPGCKNNCGSCKDNGVCDRFNGSCKLGCDAGFNGEDCKSECQHGTFGENCSSVCHCANNATCDKGNGTCSNGQCDFGYTGNSCNTDLNIIVDYNTSVTMSSMWNDGVNDWGPKLAIDNDAGPYPDTCHCCSATKNESNSWWEIEFEDVIPIMNIQIYGRQPESNQLKYAQIYLLNGTSLGSRDPFTTIANMSSNNYYNFTLPNTLLKVIRVVRRTGILTLCEVKVYMGECEVGRFGGWCAQECNCYDNMSCDFTSGKCRTPACKDGWKGPACDRECSHAQFGQNCSNRCHCYENASCNHVTGICGNDRCAPGWKGLTCSDVCNNNTFGENCTNTCNCVNACDHINGICALSSECLGGWQGDTCSERKPEDGDISKTGLIAGLVTGVVVIAILAGVICVVIRRRKAGNLKEDKLDGIDSIPVKPRDIPKTAERQHKPTVKVDNIDRSAPDGIDMANLNDVNAVDDESTYYNINIINSGIKVSELWNFIKFKSLDNYKEFAKEYKSVPKTANKSTDKAMLPRNRIKCRYKEMFPYDENRVKLDTNGGKDGDFINASYIDGTEQRNKFIASQGPQKVTVDDFWRMVWEHKSPKIVMLTNVYENDSIKIVCYWSEEEDLIFDKLTIKVLTSVSTEDYDIRDMKITHENGESHLVKQYHFKSWPDKDVPSTAWSLVDFWRKVNETKPAKKAGPIVVHCSAGVGRTGTFIAMDCLCQEAVRYGAVKPLNTLQRLREQRISMVQTLAQYVYLHEAVAEALHFGTHFVTDYQFEHLYEYMMGKDTDSNKIRLEAQYELLIESLDQPLAVEKETPVENEYGNVQTTNLEINAYRPRSKNRNSRSIQELGAICLPTFGHGNGFILCKKPSEKLICGFWNLIDEENIKTIVMVADRNSKVKVPDDLGASSSALEGRPVVNCISEKTTPSTVERTFTLKPAGLGNVQESTVNLFQYTAWKDGYVVPGDTTSVQSLLETVVQWHPLPSESQPILICCGDGVTKSGLLCVLMNELYRMRKESGQINIIESVKHMKHRQRHIITGFAQYQYCHDVIREICLQTEHDTPPNDTSSDNEQLYQNL